MTERPQAPGELELVRSFVNTNDVEDGVEELASPELLREWLAERGLCRRDATLSEEDVSSAIELREALRSLMLANTGEPLDPAAIETLNRIGARSRLLVRFDEKGDSALAPAGEGVEAALASILAIVSRSMAEGSWPRMKACQADTCRWAFYDRSKNRSGSWCSMAVCGNRAKARSYRHRHRQSEQAA
jgi:predicted RNA-binding Zn ribbon-like protein